MSAHDPLCPVSSDPTRREHCAVCVLIAMTLRTRAEGLAYALALIDGELPPAPDNTDTTRRWTCERRDA